MLEFGLDHLSLPQLSALSVLSSSDLRINYDAQMETTLFEELRMVTANRKYHY